MLVNDKFYVQHISKYNDLFHRGDFDLVNNPIELIKLDDDYLILEGQHRATIIFLHPSIFGDKLFYEGIPLAEIVDVKKDTAKKFVEMYEEISSAGFRTIPDLWFGKCFYSRKNEEKRFSQKLSKLKSMGLL